MNKEVQEQEVKKLAVALRLFLLECEDCESAECDIEEDKCRICLSSKLIASGYRNIKEIKLTAISKFPCTDCDNPFILLNTEVVEQCEIKKQKPCNYLCVKWQTWKDQCSQLAADLKEIGE